MIIIPRPVPPRRYLSSLRISRSLLLHRRFPPPPPPPLLSSSVESTALSSSSSSLLRLSSSSSPPSPPPSSSTSADYYDATRPASVRWFRTRIPTSTRPDPFSSSASFAVAADTKQKKKNKNHRLSSVAMIRQEDEEEDDDENPVIVENVRDPVPIPTKETIIWKKNDRVHRKGFAYSSSSSSSSLISSRRHDGEESEREGKDSNVDEEEEEEGEEEDLPPPLPEPKYSVRRRVLPDRLTALNSPKGKSMLVEAMVSGTAEPYVPLTEQFANQSDPAFCGITTLLVVLNAMSIDPNVRWKGGWRFFGHEDVLLSQCCISAERVRRIGISLSEFQQLAHCQGLKVDMKRPHPLPADGDGDGDADSSHAQSYGLEDFRRDVQMLLCEDVEKDKETTTTMMITTTSSPPSSVSSSSSSDGVPAGSILVVSFGRSSLGQTGDGHFSPVAAYHAGTDSVLILDVARFKYQPYWVPVTDLYESMRPIDPGTGLSRGWFLLRPPPPRRTTAAVATATSTATATVSAPSPPPPPPPPPPSEDRRPAHLVPLLGKDGPACPVHSIKVDYCRVAAAPAAQRRPDPDAPPPPNRTG